jgi:hypothetical protein
MALEDLNAFPGLLPIPQFYGHIVTSGKDKALCRVNGNGSNVIRMGLEARDLLSRVVVENSELKVIGSSDYPILSGDESSSANRHVRHLKGLDCGSGFIGPDVDVSAIEGGENPWLYLEEV